MTQSFASDANLIEAFLSLCDRSPDFVVYSQAVETPGDERRKWEETTLSETRARIMRLAGFLQAGGVKRGDRVAIISNTRPEFIEADFAVLSLGGVTVSVYQSLPAHDIGYILYDSGANFVIAENQEQVDKVLSLINEPFAVPAVEERAATFVQLKLSGIVSLESVRPHPLVTTLHSIEEEKGEAKVSLALDLKREDLATLVYTSGTTGPPKGVMQTHGNHLANVSQARQAGIYSEDSTIMLVLPLAHSFAKLMGYIGMIAGVKIMFPAVVDRHSSRQDPASVMRDLREGGAKLVPLVPRFLEKMKEGIVAKSRGRNFQGILLRRTLAIAELYGRRRRQGAVRPILSALFALTQPVRRKIRLQLFGSHFEYVISGGAKLPVPLAQFFEQLEITVLEGYGLTETCVATNVNRLCRNKIGTVGQVLAPDIEMRLADDGEIMFRGPNISAGYYNRHEATQQAWDGEGWFRTGDLGSIDAEGYLSITGRKKELIVTAGGKKIAPDPIEQKLLNTPYLSQAVIFGEGRPYCVALLGLNVVELKEWAKQTGNTLTEPIEVDSHVATLIWNHVESINRSLASFETIKRVALVSEEFTVVNGLLTPTLKVKRKIVAERFDEKLKALYARER